MPIVRPYDSFSQQATQSQTTEQNTGDVVTPSSFFGNLFNKLSGAGLTDAQKREMDYNSREAQKQRDWQEYLSSTAWQRGVSDMIAAGLNPQMMYGSGSGGSASTPSGASASASGASANGSISLGELMNIMLMSKQARLLDSQATKNEADANLTSRNAAWVDKMNQGTLDKLMSDVGLNGARVNSLDYDNGLKKAQELQILKEIEWIDRVNQAKTEADKAKAAYDYAEASISEYERKNGHRLNSSELLAVLDTIANALGVKDGETGIVNGIIGAFKPKFQETEVLPDGSTRQVNRTGNLFLDGFASWLNRRASRRK